jgi:UDP-MurNAc hydroxylase
MDGGERITVRAEGRRYSVARRCPHAGNDLEAMGTVMPGRVLRCNAHHYEFSLDDGRCLNGLGVSLDVERLD